MPSPKEPNAAPDDAAEPALPRRPAGGPAPAGVATPLPGSGSDVFRSETLAAPDNSTPEASGPATSALEQAARKARRGRPPADRGPALAPGRVLDERYEIVRFIAAGGMGEVYEANDLVLGAPVALKTIRPEIARREKAMERFRREILLARRVTHPNVCRIFDLGDHAGGPGEPGSAVTFLTMELLHGQTLDDRLRIGGRMRPEDALPLVAQMAAALQAAHEAGVVHRDFKSANVMLIPPRSSESVPRVVVTDFGLARHDDPDSDDTLTRSGHLVGTPAYMAPEQIEGSEITPAADIYAFGVVLYEVVTGRLPFVGTSPLSTVLKRFREDPASPREHVPGLDPLWESVILRCLEREPIDRFASPTDVVRALSGETVPFRRRRPLGRRAALATAAAGAALALAAGGYLLRDAIPRPGDGTPQQAPVAVARRSVAVLGFKNLSGSADTAWLSTAFAEMLASELAAGEGLRTVPGENVARMKIELALAEAESLAPDSLARIRGHIGADVVVLGSYLALPGPDGRRIRMDVRVQDTAAGETLASITETGTEQEVFELVSRAGSRLRDGLGIGALSATEAGALRASLPSDREAARLYAEGLERLRSFDAQAARGLLEKAVAADPGYAPAHAALAQAWSELGYEGRAAEAARRAFEGSSSFSREERLAIEARYREATREWPRAVEVYRSLWTFHPDDLEYGLRLAAAQVSAGRGDDARATLAAVRKLPQPLSEDPRIDLAEALAAESLGDFKTEREAASRAAAKASARGASLLRARARLAEAWALRHLGDPDGATAASREARTLYEAAGDRGGVALALLSLSNGLEDEGDLAGARKAAEEGVAIRREIGDDQGMARLLNTLANVLDAQGDMTGARRRREESLALFRKVGNPYGVAVATFNLANLMAQSGDHEGAKAHYEQALAGFRQVGNQMGIASALSGLGNQMKERGELEAARRHHEEALAIKREIGDVVGEAINHANLGFMSLLRADLKASQHHYDEGLRLSKSSANKSMIATSLTGLAEVARHRGDLAAARRRHEEALAMRAEMGEEKNAGESRLYLALLALDEGRVSDAEPAARELPDVFAKVGSPEYEAYARLLRARVHLAAGRVAEARQELQRARELAGAVQPPELRFWTALTAGRVLAAAGETAAALTSLESTVAEARKGGVTAYELEARVALGEVELQAGRAEAGRARLREAGAEARRLGLELLARQAAARR